MGDDESDSSTSWDFGGEETHISCKGIVIVSLITIKPVRVK